MFICCVFSRVCLCLVFLCGRERPPLWRGFVTASQDFELDKFISWRYFRLGFISVTIIIISHFTVTVAPLSLQIVWLVSTMDEGTLLRDLYNHLRSCHICQRWRQTKTFSLQPRWVIHGYNLKHQLDCKMLIFSSV